MPSRVRIWIVADSRYISSNLVYDSDGNIDSNYYNNQYGEGGGALGEGAWYVLPEIPVFMYRYQNWNTTNLRWERDSNYFSYTNIFNKIIFNDKIQADNEYLLNIGKDFGTFSSFDNKMLCFTNSLENIGSDFGSLTIPSQLFKTYAQDPNNPLNGGLWLTFNTNNRSTWTVLEKYQIFYVNHNIFKIGMHNNFKFAEKRLIIAEAGGEQQ